jgi:hypothetical protein
VEDVVRVVAPLESGEQSQLVCRVRPTDAALTLIGKHVDVNATRVRLKDSAVRRAAAIRSPSSAASVQRVAATNSTNALR